MATDSLLQPPEPSSFDKPESWSKWKRRFQQYRLAAGLSEKSGPRQVSTLLYCMGETSEDVLDATGIEEKDKEDYDKVIKQFDDHFQVRKNLIMERAHFNTMKQANGESVELFITALHQAASSCEFGTMKDQMIRDRLVVGVSDRSLSQKLQLEENLTLDKAKHLVRQHETVKGQGSSPKPEVTTEETTLDSMHMRQKKKHTATGQRQPTPQKRSTAPCKRCGQGPHPFPECPAKNATCLKCLRTGHYTAYCLSKTVAELTNSLSTNAEDPNGDLYLDNIETIGGQAWTEEIAINKQKVTFKVDTGAEVTAVPESTWSKLKLPTALQKSKRSLCGPDQKSLQVMGEASVILSWQQNSCQQTVYIIRGLKNSLLGLPAIRALGVLPKQLASVNASITEQYKDLFTGLGTFKGEHTIRLKPDAQPFSLRTPRNVPLPLREEVKKELLRMEQLGVISKVTEPTPWCAGMVVVPKGSGKVRICVDLKPLNESVMRELHPLPKVDSTLAQFAGAKIFSKIDTNSGFWQVPLSAESKLLTNFVTPYGRFYFNKLPFGISSAPEHFQRRMSELLADIPGVLCHVDDIVIFGDTQEEHDERLHAVLQRIQREGLTLNPAKCEFSKPRIHFLGHVIDANGVQPDPAKTDAVQKMSSPTSLSELRRIMGMLNQLNKFSPKLTELAQPLRELLSPKRAWLWTSAHEEAFRKIKEVSSPRCPNTLCP